MWNEKEDEERNINIFTESKSKAATNSLSTHSHRICFLLTLTSREIKPKRMDFSTPSISPAKALNRWGEKVCEGMVWKFFFCFFYSLNVFFVFFFLFLFGFDFGAAVNFSPKARRRRGWGWGRAREGVGDFVDPLFDALRVYVHLCAVGYVRCTRLHTHTDKPQTDFCFPFDCVFARISFFLIWKITSSRYPFTWSADCCYIWLYTVLPSPTGKV